MHPWLSAPLHIQYKRAHGDQCVQTYDLNGQIVMQCMGSVVVLAAATTEEDEEKILLNDHTKSKRWQQQRNEKAKKEKNLKYNDSKAFIDH